MSIRVVIVDDSRTMAAILQARLAAEHDIEVVGIAHNAAEGRDLIKQLDPDVVTLDVEMPGMNGLDFLGRIMTLRPTPVIIVSGSAHEGSDVAARAMALGAVACYSKCQTSGGIPADDHGRLATLVRKASKVTVRKIVLPGRGGGAGADPRSKAKPAIAIGSSTGGIEALQTLLASYPEQCPPTLIVQHVTSRFAPAIARTLDKSCAARVVAAEHNMPLETGTVYFAASGDRHMLVSGSAHPIIKLRASDPISGHIPSVDALFFSMANSFGGKGVGIILTGMGRDGAQGLLAMAQQGAMTIAQDEATCTVFGMPAAAIKLGAARRVAPIGRIAGIALESVGCKV